MQIFVVHKIAEQHFVPGSFPIRLHMLIHAFDQVLVDMGRLGDLIDDPAVEPVPSELLPDFFGQHTGAGTAFARQKQAGAKSGSGVRDMLAW